MKRYQVIKPGGLDKLCITNTEIPEPNAGEVLVRWRASSLNYHDYMVILGHIPSEDGRIPMSDGAGEVVAVGAGVTKWNTGDKVVSLFFPDWLEGKPSLSKTLGVTGDSIDGCAVEYACVNAQALTAMPNNYSFEQAATLPCAALTAWRALIVEGNLQAGDSVLVQGTGGMSMFALQIAKAAGAYVYATSSSEEKMERLKAMGADEVLNYRTDENWGITLAKRSGGIDHVLDIGADATLDHSLNAVAVGGNVTLIGVLGGLTAKLMVPKTFGKQVHMNGIAVGSREMQEKMITAINTNHIVPVIDKSFGFDNLKEAFEHQASGAHFGKIVLNYEK
ncbi:Alcohol dehydrogenase [Zhongshania aliphaticivorans]|uniref:Alcohol dehydrogenase n=1 Tax=Zhongshania aliphaticivorans TaxID=1470434 RepID=A0A5S9NS09_9GAMM|nr:NAD(P)-dependent alcohol dehydrogenase [Zhongshania aliphaticivorans]CAA0093347.1 Alcohol dehydrogenase [Zhongshania aliphaticivorans]CAA0111149.1 Alcohol dehydrogenase [Zhongshania aliphaticivorans]